MKNRLSKKEFLDYFCGESRRILDKALPDKAYEDEMILTAYGIILGHIGHIQIQSEEAKEIHHE